MSSDDEEPGGLGVEPFEDDADREVLAREASDERVQRGADAHLLRTQRSDQQERERSSRAREVVEEVKTRGVCLVEILDDEAYEPAGRVRLDGTFDGLEEAQPILLRRAA